MATVDGVAVLGSVAAGQGATNHVAPIREVRERHSFMEALTVGRLPAFIGSGRPQV